MVNVPPNTPNEAPRQTPRVFERIKKIGRNVALGIALLLPGTTPAMSGEDQEPAAEKKMIVPYTPADALKHVQGDNVRWAKLRDLLKTIPESCVDGRDNRHVIGVPGGTAGEFLLFVSALEESMGRELSEKEMEDLFRDFSAFVGPFYEHTDDHALHEATRKILKHPAFAFLDGDHDAAKELIFKGPKAAEGKTSLSYREIEDILLELLEDCIGCGHVNLLKKNWQEYGMRKEHVPTFNRMYLRQLWSQKDDIEYRPVYGPHKERAVMIVKTAGGDHLDADSDIPLVRPHIVDNGEDKEAFIYHPQAAAFIHEKFARHLDASMQKMPGFSRELFLKALRQKAKLHLDTTVMHLAKGRSVYAVTLTPDNVPPQVSGGNIVP